jgi:hypothetical protein
LPSHAFSPITSVALPDWPLGSTQMYSSRVLIGELSCARLEGWAAGSS